VARDHVEARAAARYGEGLGKRWPVVHGIAVGARRPDGCDASRLVEHRHADRVATAAARRFADHGPRGGAGARVQRVGETLQRRAAVVLDLHQRDDVGIEGHEHLHDLGELALELRRVARAAAILREPARTAAAAAIGERGEEVVDVGRGDAQVAAHARRTGAARIGACDAGRPHGMDLPGARPAGTRAGQPVVDHAGDFVKRIAGAHGAVASQVRRGRRELQRRAVVEHQAASRVGARQRPRGRAGTRDVGGRPQPSAAGQRELPETPEEEVLLHGERPRERDQHALVALQGLAFGQRPCQRHGRDVAVASQHLQVGHVVQLGDGVGQRLAVVGGACVELHHPGRQPHALARRHGRRLVGEHEDTPRGAPRVRAAGLLQEEPVAGDQRHGAFGDDAPAGERAAGSRPLDRMHGHERAGAGRGGGRGCQQRQPREPARPGARKRLHASHVA